MYLFLFKHFNSQYGYVSIIPKGILVPSPLIYSHFVLGHLYTPISTTTYVSPNLYSNLGFVCWF